MQLVIGDADALLPDSWKKAIRRLFTRSEPPVPNSPARTELTLVDDPKKRSPKSSEITYVEEPRPKGKGKQSISETPRGKQIPSSGSGSGSVSEKPNVAPIVIPSMVDRERSPGITASYPSNDQQPTDRKSVV